MSDRVGVAIVGSGNIGTDLLYKVRRSKELEARALVGIDEASPGLARARELGIWTTAGGLDAFLADPISADVAIVFDATSAATHIEHAPTLRAAGKVALDLTPAAVGPFIVPAVGSPVFDGQLPWNLNFVSCGGQATIPIVHALSRALEAAVTYAEIVTTNSSQSVGPGTRANLDEYLVTTSRALRDVGNARAAKTIALINPADPPIVMRNTIYALVEAGHEQAIIEAVERAVKDVQHYVPGYWLLVPPQFEKTPDEEIVKFTTILQVKGAGDYLPEYAGNLDIMTSAATRVAEQCATAVAGGAKLPALGGAPV
jgi:acetaldehyde dehydrogenase (acetylating)